MNNDVLLLAIFKDFNNTDAKLHKTLQIPPKNKKNRSLFLIFRQFLQPNWENVVPLYPNLNKVDMYNNENVAPQLFKSYYISNGKAVPCGERTFHYYRIDEFLRTPFPLVPSKPKTHDFRTCPGCQRVRKQIIDSLKTRYNNFPDCCEWHKNLKRIEVFDRNDYKDSHIQCADSIIYCYDFILNHQSTEDWQYTIKN